MMAFWHRWIFVRASIADEHAAADPQRGLPRESGRQLASSCDPVVFDRVAWVSERATGREIMIVRTRRPASRGTRK